MLQLIYQIVFFVLSFLPLIVPRKEESQNQARMKTKTEKKERMNKKKPRM